MKIRFRCPKIEDITLMYFLLVPMIRDVFFSHVPGGYYTMDIFLNILILLGVLKNRHDGKNYIDILNLYFVIAILFFIQFFSNPSMTVWLTREYGVQYIFLNAGIFGYPVMRIQNNSDQMLKVMKISGIILGLYYAYQSIEVLRNGYWTYFQFGHEVRRTGNMSWSYGLLFVICCLSIYIINEKKFIFIIPIIFCLIGILVYGSRGTVVFFFIGLILAVLLIHEGKMKVKNYILFGLVIIAITFLLSDMGLSIINSWFSNRGLSSRFLDLLTVKQTFDQASNGRYAIWSACLNMIKDAPFWGYGVMGERNVIYNLGAKWGYAHNIILEIIITFGWIIGITLILYAITCIFKFFQTSKNKNDKLVFVIFLTVSFELFVSNTIWFHYGPWCLMGLYVNHYNSRRKVNSYVK